MNYFVRMFSYQSLVYIEKFIILWKLKELLLLLKLLVLETLEVQKV